MEEKMFKKKALILFFFMICFIFISMNNLVAQDLDDEYEDEELLKKEADEELAAFHQYSVKYRFGKDLKVGDKVVYKVSEDFSDTDYELEVTEKTEQGLWIVEKFDGIAVHMLVDLENEKLLEFYGFDEDGNRHEPELLQDSKLNETILKMTGMIKFTGVPDIWNESPVNEFIDSHAGRIHCHYIEPELTDEQLKNIPSEELENVKQQIKSYYSLDVPKLIPFQIALPLLISAETFQEIEEGLVKNAQFDLKSYEKK